MRRSTLLVPVLLVLGCGGGDENPLVARGRSVYLSNCTACHATNPAQPGAVGPAVAGSSRELLAAKVLRNEYPPGYTPKRETAAMAPLPHLEGDIDALAAFLAADGG